MEQRILAVIGAFASVLLIALVVTLSNNSDAVPARAQSQTGNTPATTRQVTVMGMGEIKAAPDTAHIRIGVETEAESADEALQENNIRATNVISELKELGIAEKDIQTSSFGIGSTYDKDGRDITGYRVSNTVAVTIRDLDQAGELLDQVVSVGANNIYGISFSVDDPREFYEQAREKAMDNAKRKAGQLAKAGDATLGEVLVITEGSVPVQVVFQNIDRGLSTDTAQSAPQTPIQAGEETFTIQVQVTYELR